MGSAVRHPGGVYQHVREVILVRKYHNRKVEINGNVFDSIAEANRYKELCILSGAGAIEYLKLQPEYELIPAFTRRGKRFRKTCYIADFEYRIGNRIIVEDVKGFKTEAYKIKRKLFEYRYPEYEFMEVKG